MLKYNHNICPACNKNKIGKFLFFSRKTFNSLKGYKYLKCIFCKTIYLSDKKITSNKLAYIHQRYWKLKKGFQFKKKKISIQQIKEWKFTLKKLVSKKKVGLDVGCGKGIISHALSQLGLKKIYSFDVNLSETYKLKSKKIVFFNSDFENFEKNKIIKDKKFDLIMLMGVLEHSYNPGELIKKLKKFMNKKTKMLILVPNAEWLQINFLKNFAWSIEAPFHRTIFSHEGLNYLLKKNNLKSKEISNSIKMWGWTKRILEIENQNKLYSKLRKNKEFRKFDFFVDNFLEKISINIHKPPYLFVEVKQK
jgi:2-polyprenyl-3-methyl-5-hydroxy-6-metoxy-1,4-benzoquinol methylase